ncbi:NADH-quinone oxidoreductase subunit J [Lacipirellula parvula]|uniref:NADH-quinone oxidoreductase subunit J n=1 Tax=Lacipirellula parvula TaxID=2650471 RepID=A0A5K7X9S5_9BACT|nr:NADH-quinone oxidoreductase subunit J [Lacipirellula parvula]BBO32612.1 NADH-ubiquinone oxidoreductase chain J [Lacipirellula parvula]
MEQIYWPSVFFLIFGGLACAFSLAVLLSTNIVRMAFYLVLALAATAGLFFLAGQEFVGAMQLLIYVGGTLVLLIFGVMLTSQERFVNMKTPAGDWVLGMIAGGALLSLLTAAAFSVPEWRSPERAAVEKLQAEPNATPIGMGLLGARVDKIDAPTSEQAGRSGYLFPFEIVSVHLLVVLIGAAYLARAKRRANPLPTG